jgi:hypothetical protein
LDEIFLCLRASADRIIPFSKWSSCVPDRIWFGTDFTGISSALEMTVQDFDQSEQEALDSDIIIEYAFLSREALSYYFHAEEDDRRTKIEDRKIWFSSHGTGWCPRDRRIA